MMTPYDYHQHEGLLARWYVDLHKTGEFSLIFHKSLSTLTDFLKHFKEGTGLVFLQDEQGFTAALWFTPWCDGATSGVWIRQDKRQSPSVIKAMLEVVPRALSVFPVVVALTKQPHLRKLYLKLGFREVGKVPKLWGDDDVEAFYLTEDNFRWKRNPPAAASVNSPTCLPETPRSCSKRATRPESSCSETSMKP